MKQNNRMPTVREITEYAMRRFDLSDDLVTDLEKVPSINVDAEILNVCHYEYCKTEECGRDVPFRRFFVSMMRGFMYAEGMDDDFAEKAAAKVNAIDTSLVGDYLARARVSMVQDEVERVKKNKSKGKKK